LLKKITIHLIKDRKGFTDVFRNKTDVKGTCPENKSAQGVSLTLKAKVTD
jgi:hypothetical protein